MDRRVFIKKATLAAVGTAALIMTSITASAQTFHLGERHRHRPPRQGP